MGSFFNYACCLLLGVSLSEVFKRGTARWARAVGSGQCSWKHLQAIFSSTWQLAKYVDKGVKVKVYQLCKHYTVEFVKGDFGRNGAIKEFSMFLKKLPKFAKDNKES